MKKLFTILFIMLSLTIWGQNEALFQKATEAYNEGDFNTAIENYHLILDDGQHSAALYFNLGNSYYKLNQVAPSIYYYEKALLLKPNDSEITNNLGYAQNMTLDAIEALPETGFSKMYAELINFLSFDQWAYTSISFVLIFILLYLAFYFLKYATHKRIAFITSIVSVFIVIVSFAFAFIQYNEFKADQPAIVFEEVVRVKSEPNETSQEVFQLHEGTKLNVLDELNDWKKIKIADGQTGWLSSESIKLLKEL